MKDQKKGNSEKEASEKGQLGTGILGKRSISKSEHLKNDNSEKETSKKGQCRTGII